MPDDMMTFEEIQNVSLSFFERLKDSFIDYIPTLLVALGLLVVGTIVNKLVMKILGRGLKKSPLDKTVHTFFISVVKITLYLIVFITVLTILGIPMTSIITVVGSAGLAVGLSMQSSLSNVAGGVLLLIGKPFKAGDFVDINGVAGTIEEVSIIYTKLVTPDNKVIHLPNGGVSNAIVTNFTKMPSRRIEIVYKLGNTNDFQRAIEVVKRTIEKHGKILGEPEPFVRISAFCRLETDITARFWVASQDYWDVYHDMLELIRDAFVKEGIN